MFYSIQQDDNLYQIAKKYDLSIEDILSNNPGINPYNLVIGSQIYLPIYQRRSKDHHLKEKMRLVWEQHVYWTRLTIISIINNLPDVAQTTQRLLRNASDLAAVYSGYYRHNVSEIIKSLITEHLIIAAELVKAMITNNSNEVNVQNTKWYLNADEIADALSSINPYYNKEDLQKMLYEHLELTKEEAVKRYHKDYENEIKTFDEIEKQALMMADYLSEGIEKQIRSK